MWMQPKNPKNKNQTQRFRAFYNDCKFSGPCSWSAAFSQSSLTNPARWFKIAWTFTVSTIAGMVLNLAEEAPEIRIRCLMNGSFVHRIVKGITEAKSSQFNWDSIVLINFDLAWPGHFIEFRLPKWKMNNENASKQQRTRNARHFNAKNNHFIDGYFLFRKMGCISTIHQHANALSLSIWS